jgi:hypothetical protein
MGFMKNTLQVGLGSYYIRSKIHEDWYRNSNNTACFAPITGEVVTLILMMGGVTSSVV